MIIEIDRGLADEETLTTVYEILGGARITPDEVEEIIGERRIILGVKVNLAGLALDDNRIAGVHGVMAVDRISPKYKLASLQWGERTNGGHSKVIIPSPQGEIIIGGDGLVVISGPCSCEDYESMTRIGGLVNAAGAHLMRAGAYKPRTSPYDFQGLRAEARPIIERIMQETGFGFVCEATGIEAAEDLALYASMIQIGARNAQNYDLLKKVAELTANPDDPKHSLPVLLKHSMSPTLDVFLNSAEYILAGGNPNVVLCVRGAQTIEKGDVLRNTAMLEYIPLLKQASHLPVCYDPSHVGRRDLVFDLSLAAVEMGADALIVESHYDPERAKSDGGQTIYAGPLEGRNVSPKQRLDVLIPEVMATYHRRREWEERLHNL